MEPDQTRQVGQPTERQVTTDQRLVVLLAEYQTLRSEVQARTDLQNRVLQAHLTVIGLIIGVAVTADTGIRLLPIIAIESSIFGRWWLDQSITIAQIGNHLADPVEKDINALVAESYPTEVGSRWLRWESLVRPGKFFLDAQKEIDKIDVGFGDLVIHTFKFPALGAMSLSLFLALAPHIVARVAWLDARINRINIPHVYPGAALFGLFLFMFAFALYLFWQYLEIEKAYMATRRLRKAMFVASNREETEVRA